MNAEKLYSPTPPGGAIFVILDAIEFLDHSEEPPELEVGWLGGVVG